MERLLFSFIYRESAMETVSLAREYPTHVVGIDYSGNPSKGNFETLQPALEYPQ